MLLVYAHRGGSLTLVWWAPGTMGHVVVMRMASVKPTHSNRTLDGRNQPVVTALRLDSRHNCLPCIDCYLHHSLSFHLISCLLLSGQRSRDYRLDYVLAGPSDVSESFCFLGCCVCDATVWWAVCHACDGMVCCGDPTRWLRNRAHILHSN